MEGATAETEETEPLAYDNEAVWRSFYTQLQHFYHTHGHLNVPNNNSNKNELRQWMQEQHVHFSRFMDACQGKQHKQHPNPHQDRGDPVQVLRVVQQVVEPLAWNETHLQLLRQLGFIFVYRQQSNQQPNQQPKSDQQIVFDQNIQCLKDFRRHFGHINVPPPSNNNDNNNTTTQLYAWIAEMKTVYRQAPHERNPFYTRHHLQRLDDLGIVDDHISLWNGNSNNNNNKKKRPPNPRLTEQAPLPAKKPKKQTTRGNNAPLLQVQTTTTTNHDNNEDDHWETMFAQMQEFIQLHGHSIVPCNQPHYKQLRTWLDTTRKQYQSLQQNQRQPSSSKTTNNKKTKKCKQLTAHRLTRLHSIGFSFKARPRHSWHERFEQWKVYRVQNNGKDPLRRSSLGKWVTDTRSKYHARQLTDDQIQLLQTHGFVWNKLNRPTTTSSSSTPKLPWAERYQELIRYQQQHGHTRVPQKYAGGLGSWVHAQRRSYSLYQRGQPDHGLTAEKWHALHAIDFAWTSRGSHLPPSEEAANDDDHPPHPSDRYE